MKVMYLDESGDHSLRRIDPQYPVFVLGGVIVDRAYERQVIDPRLRELKSKFFADTEIVLHTADMIRAQNGFESLDDPSKRSAFYSELNQLVSSLEFKVVACAIKKDEYLSLHGADALDPYMLSLNVLVERFCYEIGDHADSGLICSEKRGLALDNALDSAWFNLLTRSGTRHIGGSVIHDRIVDLSIKDKRLNVAGLQLADLVVSPIGRAVLGKRSREDWEIVQRKFRNNLGSYRGFGLVVIPRRK